MRHLILYTSLAWIHLSLTAQSDSTHLPFIAIWDIDYSYYFMTSEANNTWKSQELTKQDTVQYLSQLQVIESNEDGFLLRLRQNVNPAELTGWSETSDQTLAYNESEIIYQIDSFGKFVEIRNWQALSDQAIQEMKKSIPESQLDGDTSGQMALLAPMIEQLSSQEGVTSFLAADIQLIHFPFGQAYSRVDTVNFETALPNVFGGAPIEADGKLFIDQVDRENSLCLLVQEIKIKPGYLNTFLEELFKRMGAPPAEIPDAIKDTKMDIVKTLRYSYQYEKSLPDEVSILDETISEIINKTQRKRKLKTVKLISQVKRSKETVE